MSNVCRYPQKPENIKTTKPTVTSSCKSLDVGA